jgi:hypothetical protein
MHRVALTLVLLMIAAGCGTGSSGSATERIPSGSAMGHMMRDAGGWTTCPGSMPPDAWVTGVITPTSDGFAAIRDDLGALHPLMWGSGNTATVEWGGRYRIGGIWFNSSDTLWACAGAEAVIPQ